MKKENIELRQDELKDEFVDMNKNKITFQLIEEKYENHELERIVKRYISLSIMKCIPRNKYERDELEELYNKNVLSIKIRGGGDDDSHSHKDFEECCDEDDEDQKFEDNLSEYDNRDDEDMFLELAKAQYKL